MMLTLFALIAVAVAQDDYATTVTIGPTPQPTPHPTPQPTPKPTPYQFGSPPSPAPGSLPFRTPEYTVWTTVAANDFEFNGDLFTDYYAPTQICYQAEYTVTNVTPAPTMEPYTMENGDYATPAPTPAYSTFYLPTTGIVWWGSGAPTPYPQAPTPAAAPAAPATTEYMRKRQDYSPAGEPGAPAYTTAAAAVAATTAAYYNTAYEAMTAYWSEPVMSESYNQYFRIAVGTNAQYTNTAWQKQLVAALGLSRGELRDTQTWKNPTTGEKLFVFGLSDAAESRYCEIYAILNALDYYTADSLQLGGADILEVASDFQLRVDGGNSASSVGLSLMALVLMSIATLF